MHFVYICRDGENEELRYSIRSVYKNFPDAKIYLFGGKPNWYLGNFILVKDTGNKFTNINNCYKEIIKNNNISNDFILMNDDFFIFSNQINYYYYSGYLKDKIIKHSETNGNSSYARALKSGVKVLKKLGVSEPLNYDIHAPITLNKAKLAQVIDLSLAPRSVYGNLFINNGINIDDVKLYKNDKINKINTDFISTEDDSFYLIEDQLKFLFPNKSILEN